MEDQTQIFEINYLFNEPKDIFKSLEKIESIYGTLHKFDNLVLRHVAEGINMEYTLVGLEYSSFKTKVEQLIKSIPDDLLKKPDIKTLVGLLLIKLKYWLLNKLSENREITTKEQIVEIADKINKEIRKIGKDTKTLTSDVSNYAVLDALTELSFKANELKDNEAYEYKSKFGTALLKRGNIVNKQKILSELGAKAEISQTTEIIKPKKIDLLSDTTSWTCILKGRSVPIKISDMDWLSKYHNQEEIIASGDLLKVNLLTTYIYNPTTPKTKITYEVLKVEKIIKPSESNEQSLF